MPDTKALPQVVLYKAQPCGANIPRGVCIIIGETLPDQTRKALVQVDLLSQTQAEKLARALWENLPGAVLDRLMASLFLRRMSHFTVVFDK